MNRLRGSRRLLLTVGALLMAVLFLPAPSSGAARAKPKLVALSPLVTLEGSVVPKLVDGAVRVGALSPSATLHLELTLRLPHPAALEQFVSSVSDRSSPLFHHYLAKGRFARRFGPSPTEVEQVTSAARRLGLRVDAVAADRLSVRLSGKAKAVETAFHTPIESYRLPGGQLAYANSSRPMLPAGIATDVESVIGLNDLLHPRSFVVRAKTAPRGDEARAGAISRLSSAATEPTPCAAASGAANSFGTLTADQLASYYDMTGLYDLGDYGQGVHVGLIEFEPNLVSDISAYASCYGISPKVAYHSVGGGGGTGAGAGEAALDIEDVMGLAPSASIDVWQGSASGSGPYDTYSAAINADTDQVLSSSWGLCELDIIAEVGTSYLSSEQALFEQAAAQGQSVLAAAGDKGSTACYGDSGTSYASSLSVEDPASQPNVISVGGTSVGANQETTWSNDTGAGGGGVSAYWCMPAYQDQPAIPGLSSAYSVVDTADCSSSSSGALLRQVPDVSADADPYTGYTIYYKGGWWGIGGTSAAAPLWAAVAALIDASPFCADYASGPAGVQPAGLYAVASSDESYIYGEPAGVFEALYDVTSGSNDFTSSGYEGGLYPATEGYDMASGLGTPVVSGLTGAGKLSNFYPGLAALMCFAYATANTSTKITSVSPSVGATGTSTALTIIGSGFLPIAGADELKVGSKTVAADCSSSSRCTATLPPSASGTVDLRMLVEDMTESPISAVDRFTYEATPKVTMSGPELSYRLSSDIAASYSASGANAAQVASYDVRYSDSKWSSANLGAAVYPKAWQKIPGRTVHLAGRPGFRYCISARAVLRSGLTTSWSPQSCMVVPLAASSLHPTTKGWTHRSGSSYYLHGAFVTKTKGATLRLVGAEASQLALVVTKCPTCGVLGVYVNGELVRQVNTHSTATHHQVIVVLPARRLSKATVELKDLTKGRQVVVEGLGID